VSLDVLVLGLISAIRPATSQAAVIAARASEIPDRRAAPPPLAMPAAAAVTGSS
jgi:hypothetical protein